MPLSLHQHHSPYVWKQMPFARLLIPLMLGISTQWYLQPDPSISLVMFVSSFVAAVLLSLLGLQWRYRLRWVQGNMINVGVAALGMLLTHQQDISNNPEWVGQHYENNHAVIATLTEPLTEKAKTFKAEATINAIQVNNEWKNVVGKVILYFRKDSIEPAVTIGSRVLFVNKLQPIRNSGNPGAFDYARYCAFRGIHHQVFVKQGEYKTITSTGEMSLSMWLNTIKAYVLSVLKTHIDGKEESGVAEALLVGYRNDLDKDLVQAYSNTGVVHIIAISGLHLALIYGIMIWLLHPLKKTRGGVILSSLIIIVVLWMFALIAGAAPSIVRSAVMFSLIIVGQLLNRKGSIYNVLAGAAFVMLCYDPFYLWDVGFQLSFTAVLSIVLFMQPVYRWFYIRNKFLDGLWKLTAVTLSAQVLTFPIIIYYFHQFPLMFVLSNFVAVPLSALILKLELLLVAFSFSENICHYIGFLLHYLLWFLNSFIRSIDKLPYAVYDNIHVNVLQAYLLYGLIIAAAFWLLQKWHRAMYVAAVFLLMFVLVDGWEKRRTLASAKMIVYNVPKHHAIDFVEADSYQFVGDSNVLKEAMLTNFHLKPARTQYRLRQQQHLQSLAFQKPFIYFNNKRILVIDRPLKFEGGKKIPVDVIVLTKNPKVYITNLHKAFDCHQFVFDATNPQWKINLWEKDCDSLNLRHHSTPEKGAFVMEL